MARIKLTLDIEGWHTFSTSPNHDEPEKVQWGWLCIPWFIINSHCAVVWHLSDICSSFSSSAAAPYRPRSFFPNLVSDAARATCLLITAQLPVSSAAVHVRILCASCIQATGGESSLGNYMAGLKGSKRKHHTISLTFQDVASVSIQPRNSWITQPCWNSIKLRPPPPFFSFCLCATLTLSF